MEPDRADHDEAGEAGASRRSDAEQLIAVAHDLEHGPAPQRRATARRRGRVIHDGEVLDEPDADATARVRSTFEEGGDSDEADGPPGLIDASGMPVTQPSAPRDAASSSQTGAVPGSDAHAPQRTGGATSGTAVPGGPDRADRAGVPDGQAAAFLAMAVRSYLDGIDRFGADSEVTLDRLARLRETLSVYDTLR